MKDIRIIIHDVRSIYNVGAMFRTAEAAGVNDIFLSGYTPLPVDRFGRKRNDFSKSALGSENTIKWEHKKNISNLLMQLKENGFTLIAIEQWKKSINYKKVSKLLNKKNKIVFIVGNEVSGLQESILKKSDIVAEIPMMGKKESLNVSVAFGIALFRILNI
ncbi:MAG: tRNA/rRNA methyltransferase [Candidatus Nomurabacteria bacterium GW2011_GWB1_37_5]|uniref:tRNA/rRNA methyltransferase n=1 Tax=Candidatus Nomurabacteria bacterium GW2011_GWB1_37_5 TaxID=1618742 RepID=A0A0G0H8D8_9BACT|nr:MAG: tRNA/rRNA methyltransferase [Candidatus Nomurabacteria bacterium GW2011_GWB1_37_5]